MSRPLKTKTTDVLRATHEYEAWMRRCTKVVESELTGKHEQMRSDPFLFFRGTYYRWTQLWPEICDDLHKAPRVVGVGDLHVGSFGTWRDREGRLCWGVDDFDDAYPLPYTNDLVRLAASIRSFEGWRGWGVSDSAGSSQSSCMKADIWLARQKQRFHPLQFGRKGKKDAANIITKRRFPQPFGLTIRFS